MKKYTIADVRPVIQALAEARKDFTYMPPAHTQGTCVYSDKGAPSCIVGHWMFNEGIELPMDTNANQAEVQALPFGDWLHGQGVTLSPAARDFLAVVQYEQDMGRTWGHAYDVAEAAGYAEDPDEL